MSRDVILKQVLIYASFAGFILLFLLFVGCGPNHSWFVQRGPASNSDYASSKLILPAMVPTDEIELEFMHTKNGVELFLVVRGRPIAPNHNNSKEVPLFIESLAKNFSTPVYRHAGGQKFTVPIEVQTFIIESLNKGESLTLILSGYRRKIDPKGFSTSYDALLHTPYLNNPFVLPF